MSQKDVNERMTTENTGHFAGEWYRLPDGTPRYWTLEEVARQRALNHKGEDLAEIASAVNAVRSKRQKRKPNAHQVGEEREYRQCVICGTRFKVEQDDKMTCSPFCAGRHRKEQEGGETKQRTA